MAIRLGLLRHGLASGQEPEAALLEVGARGIRRLAARLRTEGWHFTAAYSSPFRRARETATLMLAATEPGLVPMHLTELAPEADAGMAHAALRALAGRTGDILVVSHLPLIARLAREITGGTWDFKPGTWLEIAIEGDAWCGTPMRRLEPDDSN